MSHFELLTGVAPRQADQGYVLEPLIIKNPYNYIRVSALHCYCSCSDKTQHSLLK